MSETATVTQTIDSVVEQLDQFHQRATYGAVAGVLRRSPRNLMAGRSRSEKDSWIVSNKDGQPTGYSPEQLHPELKSRDQILRNTEELTQWLADPG